eukprot:Blabericola_migrator_1__1441@NODE_1379_length_4678_cov_105_607244_g924_i0_p2_GENE_NODE_1379_length_4678_cov_105_607244_g924_i0NODE_1379_length_4678_cov_105_607244_g924_i0_p2_ORF_typecomplete_len312_score48_31adh_short/PF00106_25/1_9e42adh_short_C2/PF13561_6/1_9e30KR/PF08659_10/1_5e12Sacchrp_dh_NADP/PF03435_18/5_8e05Sacchrp_dh_NADP/PF03435_18/1_2e03Shikimate_DH/PF01488_20/0_024Shikimate_DH/PF01488_20/1_3e02DUF1776/PF08643_10/0_0026Polysacc_synt_2/PF02719_15/0_088Amdase/PF17645_1/2_3e03Amdase/PF17
MLLLAIGCVSVVTFIITWTALIKAWAFPRRKLEDLGPWAIVTGCTDGIGRAYATHLAAANTMNLCLMSRSKEKLDTLKDDLVAAGCKRDIVVLPLDFSDVSEEQWEQVAKELADKEIGLLINNVGVSYPTSLYLHEVSNDLMKTLINVNVVSVFRMTRMVIKGMCDRNRGAVLCVGSISGAIPSPLLAGYSAVKASVAAFCKSLQAECREHNVIVQCHAPGFVVTKMSKLRKSSFTAPTPDVLARWSLRILKGTCLGGLLATPTVLSPYPIHAVLMEIASRLPDTMLEKYTLREQLTLRRKYQAKQAKAAA